MEVTNHEPALATSGHGDVADLSAAVPRGTRQQVVSIDCDNRPRRRRVVVSTVGTLGRG